MDTNLLRSWLGLPPGPWPPDDRTLLGLSGNPPDAAEAERRALTLMGRLRPHQLVHPELVTEGMNRLAQALLAVTAVATAPPRPTPAAPLPPPRLEPEPEPELAAPAVLDVVADEEPAVAESDPAAPAPPRPAPRRPSTVLRPIPAPIPVALSEPAPIGPTPADRRAAYRELAGLRGLLQAWDRLRLTIADPSTGLTTPGEVFEFLEGVQAVRTAAIHPGLDPATVSELAPTVAALLRQPLPLAVFRSLVPAQRQVLARDWAGARGRLLARSAALRTGVARAAGPHPSVTAAGIAHTMIRNPEWSLIVASGLILVAAAVRLVTR